MKAARCTGLSQLVLSHRTSFVCIHNPTGLPEVVSLSVFIIKTLKLTTNFIYFIYNNIKHLDDLVYWINH